MTDHTATKLMQRIRHASFPPGYEPQQVTRIPEGIEVAALEYWFLLDEQGQTALLPRGVRLQAAERETLEQFVVRCALTSEGLLSPDV